MRGLRHSAGRSFTEHDLREEGSGPRVGSPPRIRRARWPDCCGTPPPAYSGRTTGPPSTARCRTLAPGESVALPATYFYVGEGNGPYHPALVADALRRAGNPGAAPARGPQALGVRPGAAASGSTGGQADGKLVVDSVGRLELSGALTVTPPPELEVAPSTLAFEGVCEACSLAEPVKVRARKGAAPRAAISSTSTLDLDRATLSRTPARPAARRPEAARNA